MKISWLILTYNRLNSVSKAIVHCMENAGRKWDEIIWCDNGSRDGVRDFMLSIGPDVAILNDKNLGVARGYNSCLAHASGTHVVITGCDMMMPNNWLDKMARCFEEVPNTGIVTIYAEKIDKTPERIRGDVYDFPVGRVRPAMPIGRRMLSRELQREIGYFHEGFGLYGWDDVAWGHTAERVCNEKKLLFYNLIDETAVHLGTEGNVGYDHKDEHSYWRWKKEQVNDPKKQALLEELSKKGYPKYTPF